ncbi:hypothetical protein AMTRI_Chr03g52810 [Amborella trichopoda]
MEELSCRKHPNQKGNGVCPICLRNRLSRLCPDCGATRPCPCSSAAPSSSSSSFCSFSSSFSSSDLSKSGTGIGAVGRISTLIDKEGAFSRSKSSRSAHSPIFRSKTAGDSISQPKNGEEKISRPKSAEETKSGSFWKFWRSSKKKKEEKVKCSNEFVELRFPRSKSVGFQGSEVSVDFSGGFPAGKFFGGGCKSKGWSWALSSPIRVLWYTKRDLNGRSPMSRG